MIDSHCHLTASKFNSDREEVIQRALDSGVQKIITIGDTLESSREAVELAQSHLGTIFATIGIHPHVASSWNNDVLSELATLSEEDGVVGIGEIGLDYHYNHSPRDMQKLAFEAQLNLAKERGLPASIHTREAIEDTWEIVHTARPEKFVLHCCCEKFTDIDRFIHIGGYVSFTGIASYPSADDIRETITQCPLDRILIETDAPYLAPVPHRGKRNEPAFVIDVARSIAVTRGISLDELAKQTDTNTQILFGL